MVLGVLDLFLDLLNMSRILFLLFALYALGCSPKSPEADAGVGSRFTVVATTGIIADALRNIAGPDADVIALMGPGVDPHLYKATQGDLGRLRAADLIVYNGLHLEGKLAEVLHAVSRDKPVYAMAANLDSSRLRRAELGGSSGQGATQAVDPHIWFDVSLWRQTVAGAARELARVDTAHARGYLARSEAYLLRLDSLHAWVAKEMNALPAERRVLVTAHDAFGYFGAAYGVEVRALQGLSTAAEFGLNDIRALVGFLVERKVKALFVETSVPTKSLEAVIEGCRDRGHTVRIGGSLYSDALGAADGDAGSYIGMVRANVSTLTSALK